MVVFYLRFSSLSLLLLLSVIQRRALKCDVSAQAHTPLNLLY